MADSGWVFDLVELHIYRLNVSRIVELESHDAVDGGLTPGAKNITPRADTHQVELGSGVTYCTAQGEFLE